MALPASSPPPIQVIPLAILRLEVNCCYILGGEELDNSGTGSEAASRCADTADSHSNIESVLDSDMTTKGATLTQNELNAQGGNSVVAILTKILDEPDLELRTETAEGLCKLLMIGAISSPKLLSRLLLIWYTFFLLSTDL